MKIKQAMLDRLLELHAIVDSLPSAHMLTDEQARQLMLACGKCNFWVNEFRSERAHEEVEVAE